MILKLSFYPKIRQCKIMFWYQRDLLLHFLGTSPDFQLEGKNYSQDFMQPINHGVSMPLDNMVQLVTIVSRLGN